MKAPGNMNRRDFLGSSLQMIVSWFFISQILKTNALANSASIPIQEWLKNLNEKCHDLKRHALTPLEWQEQLKLLYARVSLPDIIRLIDFERLTKHIEYQSAEAVVKEVIFPKMEGIPDRLNFGHKIFALQKGQAIVPHVHNNMVSAHLILKGKFQIKTYDRIFQEEEANHSIHLKKTRDEEWSEGKLLTMSDEKDNGHWLRATTPSAFTFDVPVSHLNFRTHYPSKAGEYDMIFVDPTGKPDRQGIIRAPILKPEFAFQKFGIT